MSSGDPDGIPRCHRVVRSYQLGHRGKVLAPRIDIHSATDAFNEHLNLKLHVIINATLNHGRRLNEGVGGHGKQSPIRIAKSKVR